VLLRLFFFFVLYTSCSHRSSINLAVLKRNIALGAKLFTNPSNTYPDTMDDKNAEIYDLKQNQSPSDDLSDHSRTPAEEKALTRRILWKLDI